jgi:hypothetical protein
VHPVLLAQHRVGQLQQGIPVRGKASVQLAAERREQPACPVITGLALDLSRKPGHTERHGHRLHADFPWTGTDGAAVAARCHGDTPRKPANP